MAAQNPQTPATDDSFENRHANELGIKRFATVTGLNTIIPLAAAAGAGALGYFALGRPVRFIAGKWITRGGNIAEFLRAVGRNLTHPEKLAEIGGKLTEAVGPVIDRIAIENPGFQLLSREGIQKVLGSCSETEMDLVRQAFNMTKPDTGKYSQYAAAGIAGTVGLLVGGTAVNYNEWRKEESARLAAAEVNKNISELELFKPSDQELVSENKRLRAMLAAKDGNLPDAKITEPATAGKIISPVAAVLVAG